METITTLNQAKSSTQDTNTKQDMQDTQIIMDGRLLYQEPIAWAGTGGDWVCVDLKTGQEIWRNKQ